jgi:guanylate kinase
MQNNLIVICGFSASGKDSITKYIADNYNYKMIMSHTSRPMRPNESEGNPYYFVTRKQFEEMLSNNTSLFSRWFININKK